jgi:hypothetical protein
MEFAAVFSERAELANVAVVGFLVTDRGRLTMARKHDCLVRESEQYIFDTRYLLVLVAVGEIKSADCLSK